MRAEGILLFALTALASSPLASQETESAGEATEAAQTLEKPTIEPVAQQAQLAPMTLAAGSVVSLRTVREISSKKARKGDLLELEIAEDYVVDGVIILPSGTAAVAELTVAEKKGWMGRAGKLAARMLYLDLPGGPVRLSGELGEKGKGNGGVATVVSAFTGFGFITGKSAVIPEGTELVARLDREARIPVLTSLEKPAEEHEEETADSAG